MGRKASREKVHIPQYTIGLGIVPINLGRNSERLIDRIVPVVV